MFNTLYKKLSAILLLILLAVGIALVFVIRYGSEMFQHEVAQRLNADLAAHIASEDKLINKNVINQDALKNIFHMLMVINPSIELYLLDMDGNILAYSAPENHVKREKVDLKPIRDFLAQRANYPLYGDDPRSIDKRKIFSATPIMVDDVQQGYLYVILHSENLDSVVAMLEGSYILRYSLYGLGFIIALALLTGLILLSVPTRRLSQLSLAITNYLEFKKENNRYPRQSKDKSRDEIDELGRNFNAMADKIDTQLKELANNDAKRRELIASVSHDLRTPLTSLSGYLETLSLKAGQLTEEEKLHYIQIASEQTKHLTRLVSELFELARLDSVETLITVEAFSLAELAQDVAQKFQLSCQQRGIELVVDFGDNLPFAYGDIGLMQRVLENLVDNAIRHTLKGGRISLSLSGSKDKIQVTLTDTGIGIAQEDLPHIFERFYHKDRVSEEDKKGAGLGLAIAKRILNLHGSNIEAESTLNVGTTFRFALPTNSIAA